MEKLRIKVTYEPFTGTLMFYEGEPPPAGSAVYLGHGVNDWRLGAKVCGPLAFTRNLTMWEYHKMQWLRFRAWWKGV